MRKFNFLFNLPSFAAVLHDVISAAIAWMLAYYLRFNLEFSVASSYLHLSNLAWILPLQMITFVSFGLYQGIWRFASIPDLFRILKAVVVSTLAIAAVILMYYPAFGVPRSVLVINALLLLLFMGGSRLI